MYKISIAMPAYNAEKYIKEAIESILAQTYTDWELVITDDCSTDDTVSIVEEYTSKYNNITLIKRKKNSGGCKLPRFEAILAAKGEFVCPIDADDFIEPEYIEKLYTKIIETQSTIVLGTMVLYDNTNGDIIGQVPNSNFEYNTMSGYEACKLTIGGWKIALAGLLAKTEYYQSYIQKKYDHDKNFRFSDEIDHRRLLLSAPKVAFIKSQYFYRQIDNSIIHIKNIQYYDRLKALNILYDFVKDNFSNDTAVMKNIYYEYIGTVSNCRRTYLYYKQDFNKEEKQIIKRLIQDSFRRIKQEKMTGKTYKQKIAVSNYTIFKITSFIEHLSSKF